MALHDENVVWHAHPVTPQQREQRHGHRGVVLWFTGLSGSGKSTVAGALEEALLLPFFCSFLTASSSAASAMEWMT